MIDPKARNVAQPAALLRSSGEAEPRDAVADGPEGPIGEAWLAVHTQAYKETLAASHLARAGFAVYFPRYRRTVRHAGKRSTVLRPLFPSYLFLSARSAIGRLHEINRAVGVRWLVGGGCSPAFVPPAIIEEIRRREIADGVVALAANRFKRGDRVRVMEGPLAGVDAIFEEVDDGERVRLLVCVMGRAVSVRIPGYAIEHAG